MHSGRIVIANRSAVGLKCVLFPSSKAIRRILNHWMKKYWYGNCLTELGGGTWQKDPNGPSLGGVGEKDIFHQNVSCKALSSQKLILTSFKKRDRKENRLWPQGSEEDNGFAYRISASSYNDFVQDKNV